MKIYLVLTTVFVATLAYAQGHDQVARGNQLFEEEKYDEANNKYRDAMLENPESPVIHFNIGDVQYKKNNYEEAIKAYEKALSSEDIKLQSQSYYNMGNSLYKMGKLPESIMAYKKALELNPNDEDAKYNLEYVRKKLKDQAEKQPQQNQQQQQQQNKQSQNQQDQNQDQNSDQEQQKQDQGQKEQRDEQQQQQQQEQQDSKENEENQDEQAQQQPQPEQVEEISKEDAERILNALQNEEEDLLKQQKPKQVGRAFRGKDW